MGRGLSGKQWELLKEAGKHEVVYDLVALWSVYDVLPIDYENAPDNWVQRNREKVRVNTETWCDLGRSSFRNIDTKKRVSLSRALSHLEQRGLIERNYYVGQCNLNKRGFRGYELTDQGRELLKTDRPGNGDD